MVSAMTVRFKDVVALVEDMNPFSVLWWVTCITQWSSICIRFRKVVFVDQISIYISTIEIDYLSLILSHTLLNCLVNDK